MTHTMYCLPHLCLVFILFFPSVKTTYDLLIILSMVCGCLEKKNRIFVFKEKCFILQDGQLSTVYALEKPRQGRDKCATS